MVAPLPPVAKMLATADPIRSATSPTEAVAVVNASTATRSRTRAIVINVRPQAADPTGVAAHTTWEGAPKWASWVRLSVMSWIPT
jgi:hypothetical protein